MLTALCYMVGVIGLVRIWQNAIQLELLFRTVDKEVDKKEDKEKEHDGLYLSFRIATIGGLVALAFLLWITSTTTIIQPT